MRAQSRDLFQKYLQTSTNYWHIKFLMAMRTTRVLQKWRFCGSNVYCICYRRFARHFGQDHALISCLRTGKNTVICPVASLYARVSPALRASRAVAVLFHILHLLHIDFTRCVLSSVDANTRKGLVAGFEKK